MASRSSAGEQANSGRQRPALIAAPPRGAAPARAPLALSPRQWAPGRPSPRPRTASATRARGGGRGLPGAGGWRVGEGGWGVRGRDWIGGRARQSVQEIPIPKCEGAPTSGSGVPGSWRSCAGVTEGVGRAGSRALAVLRRGPRFPTRGYAAGRPVGVSEGAGGSVWLGCPRVPLGTAEEEEEEGGRRWARSRHLPVPARRLQPLPEPERPPVPRGGLVVAQAAARCGPCGKHPRGAGPERGAGAGPARRRVPGREDRGGKRCPSPTCVTELTGCSTQPSLGPPKMSGSWFPQPQGGALAQTRVQPPRAATLPGARRATHRREFARCKHSWPLPSQNHAQAPARRLRPAAPAARASAPGTGLPAGDRAGSPNSAINHLARPRSARTSPSPRPGREAPRGSPRAGAPLPGVPPTQRPARPTITVFAKNQRERRRFRGAWPQPARPPGGKPAAGSRAPRRLPQRPPEASAGQARRERDRAGGRGPGAGRRRRVRAEARPERGSGRSSPRGWELRPSAGGRAGSEAGARALRPAADVLKVSGTPAVVPEAPGLRPARWKTRGSCPNLGGTGGYAQALSWTREFCPRPGGHAARPGR